MANLSFLACRFANYPTLLQRGQAKNARYIPDKNIVLIRMSKAAVQKLPEVKS